MKTTRPIVLALLMSIAGLGNAANYCGELKNHFGPFDYRERAAHAHDFGLVEGAHFTPEVENGVKGKTGQIGGDLNYTLRAIPNHHRALASIARLSVRNKSLQLPGAHYPTECYFDRASRFTPDDGGVFAAYGNYMFAMGKHEKAFTLFQRATALDPDNPTINYNLGLAYFKKKDYDQANTYAKKAYALGFPLPGLKNRLKAVGKWDGKPE